MSLTGNSSSLNTAGAEYGTDYCDAQCPKNSFVKGKANLNGTVGACCNEMDIWEANNAANALTPHPCNATEGGKVIHNSHVEIKGMSTEYNSITDSYCKAEDKAFNAGAAFPFENRGGMTQMGKALARGMVLVLSIWDDSGAHMQWLDGATGNVTVPGNLRGPCSPTGSDPVAIQAQYPNASVTWSNIKVGDIGTIYQGGQTLRESMYIYMEQLAIQ